MTLVVEFAGLPGCGKSTLCRSVVAALQDAGVDAADRSLPAGATGRGRRLARKASALLRSTAAHPARSARLARACRRSGLAGRELVARTGNLAVLRAQMQGSARDVVLFDQGLVQELASVSVTADHHALASDLPDGWWPERWVIIRVRTPVDTVVDRLRRRGTAESRMEALGGTALLAALERFETALDGLAGALDRPPPGVEIWEVDTGALDSVAVVAERIRRSTEC